MPIADAGNGNFHGTFILFKNMGHPPERLTDTWHVYASDASTQWSAGVELGHIAWFGKWRKYCFFPNGATVFEETCLHEIAQFIVQITWGYRQDKKHNKQELHGDPLPAV